MLTPFSPTFIVESDATLDAWARHTAGNDYTHILIAEGTFTSSRYVFLTDSRTKTVLGEEGSKLVFTTSNGIRGYESNFGSTVQLPPPLGNDFWIKNVTVETQYIAGGTCFRECVNLVNCTGNSNSLPGNSGGVAAAFAACLNLKNCVGVCNFLDADKTSGGAYGFQTCRNLDGCTSISNSIMHAYGFLNCEILKDCTGTGVSVGASTNSGYAFQNCYSMTHNHAEAYSKDAYLSCYIGLLRYFSNQVSNTEEGGWNS
jgi:hypothetical protein